MAKKEYTLINLLNDGLSILIKYVLGVFMIGVGLFMLYQFMDYKKNIEKIEKLEIVDSGRVHIFTPSFSRTKCVVFKSKSGVYWEDVGYQSQDNETCEAFSKNINSWEETKLTHNRQTFNLFIGIVLTIIIFFTTFGYILIPLYIIVIIVKNEWLYENVKIISLLLSTPVLIFGMNMTIQDSFNPPSNMWLYDGKPVNTYAVYLTKDKSMHRAPEVWYQWPESHVGRRVVKFN